MGNENLALKYRPRIFKDVTEQFAISNILFNQINNNDIKNGYLFTGASGCGKTTSARIFASEINKGMGTPYEIDAASNNGVDNVRDIIEQAKLKSLESEYKVFIIDECHMLSIGAWNAMLKILEEPPKGVVFMFCTTEPKKVLPTILSRVQRFDFRRISYNGILDRLKYILDNEISSGRSITYEIEALEFIAKMADGGMRSGITMLDKCLSLSDNLTYKNVCDSLGIIPYDQMFVLLNAVINKDIQTIINLIESIYMEGIDLKQFISDYASFLLDIVNYYLNKDFNKIKIPPFYNESIQQVTNNPNPDYKKKLSNLLFETVLISNNVKYEDKPKFIITTGLMKQCGD